MEELVGFDALTDFVLGYGIKIEWEMFVELCHRFDEEPTWEHRRRMGRVMGNVLQQGDRELIAKIRAKPPTCHARMLAIASYLS